MKNFSRRSIRSSENSRRIRPASTKRRLLGELLEHRQLLAGDVVEVMPHHNYWAPTDVNQDAKISPLDALTVVNDLNRNGSRPLSSSDFAPTQYIDVNNDGYASPVDALQVINALNRGVPEAVGEVIELQVGLRDLQGNNMLSAGSRTAQVSPGQLFNIELLYKDLRNQFQTPRGLASAYVDFLVSQPTAIEPVVTETHIADFSYNIVESPSGTIVIGVEGTTDTVTVTGEQFNSGGLAPIAAAIQDLLDLSQPPTLTATPFTGTPGEPDILRVKVRYEGEEFYNTDVPNLTIDTSNLTAQGEPVTVSTRIVPAILADGSVNGAAVAENLQLVSRTNGEVEYNFAVSGSYSEVFVPAVPPVPATETQPAVPGQPAIQPGFNEVGGFSAEFGIDDYAEPFHAFSILVRAVEPAENVVIQVDPPDNENRKLIMENVDQAIPNSQILIDTDDSGAISGDDRPGLVILNIVEGVSARPDTLTVQEDRSASVNVLTNDVSVVAGALTLVSVSTPAHGAVTFNANGSVNYTPSPNYFGPDSFTYVARNSQGDTGMGTVTVNVTAVNDDPTFAADPVRNGTEDTTLAIPTAELLTNDSAGPNETGQTLSVTAVAATSNAGGPVTFSNGTINYTPPNHFNGTDRITYTISDGAGGTTTGTVTISVAAVNDPPQLALSPLTVAEDTTLSVAQSVVLGSSRPGPVSATDEASQTLLITAAGTSGATAQGGTVSVDGSGRITYTPALNFFGTDTFPITVADNGGESTTGMVTVTVTAVNDAPVAVNDTLVVDELSVDNVLNVLGNDSAGPGEGSQTITITSITPGANFNGTATISQNGQAILYTPESDFIGTATLTYVITDNGNPQRQSQAATVTIQVVPVLRPRAVDDHETIAEDSETVTLPITANDLVEENETATLASVSGISPAHAGMLVQSGNSVQFTPAADFFGEVSFTYMLSYVVDPEIADDQQAAATGTVTITVTPVNDAPVFNADPVIDAVEDTELRINAATLLANDGKGAANESSQTLSVSAVNGSSTAGGTVSLQGQTIVYLPKANFNGPDTFTYTIVDSEGETTTGTATITVESVNDDPELALNPIGVAEDTTLTVEQSAILGSSTPGPASATDESSQTLQVTSVGTAGLTAQGGSVSINGVGQIVYTPAEHFFGTDTFPITVTDSRGASTSGVVTVNVTAVNDTPVFGDPPLIAFSKTTMTFNASQLLANSTAGPANESNQTLSVVGATAISGTTGTVTFNANGTVSYTPAEEFLGEDQFQITISDGELQVSGIVTVDVQEFQPSVISGAVFFDYIESLSNQVRDGVKDADEPGLQMANVRLVSSASANVTGVGIDVTLATDVDGQFQFNNVPPGTYRLIFEVPQMVYDGADFAGTAGDLDSIQNQFTIEIEQPGGIDASGYNFTLYGTSGRAGNALDMLVSSFLRNQSSGSFTASSSSSSGLLGATAVLDANGKTEWFKAGEGFEGVRFGEINLNAAASKATLSVVLEDGTVLTGWVPKDRFVFLRDGSGNTVVQIFGGLSDFNLVADGTLDVNSAGLLSYQSAVDQLLSQPGSVI